MSDETTDAVADALVAKLRSYGTAVYVEAADRIEALEAKLAAVRALHFPLVRRNAVDWCSTCSWKYYPCATLRALDGVEAVQAVLDAEPSAEAGER